MQSSSADTTQQQPWQLQMFSRSLKKQLKLNALVQLTGNVDNQSCLLLSCGDNNGALNWHFRKLGGIWQWGDVIGENLDEMGQLLDEPVIHVPEEQFPYEDDQFDCIIAIDVLEHLDNDQPFLHELKRILKPNGRAVVTVPNGDPKLLANRIKFSVGMTPEQYGHTRAGYTIPELTESIEKAGMTAVDNGGYSRFFTEMMELTINFAYVFVLSRKKSDDPPSGQIAPTSSGELKTHGAAYKIYSLLYPIMSIVSKLDGLLSARSNNAVIVVARK